MRHDKEDDDDLVAYCGIADCDGLESFYPAEQFEEDNKKGKLGYLRLRCKINAQRNPIIYRVTLKRKDALAIKDYLSDDEYIQAHLYMKKAALLVEAVLDGSHEYSEDRWNNIPTLTEEEAKRFLNLTQIKGHRKAPEVKQLELF